MNLFVLDCGQCGSHVYNTTTNEYCKIDHVDVINLNIPNINDGDLIVVEEAHMRSQEKNSLAQPFTYEQLKTFYFNAKERNIKIKLFPQKVTPTARKVASLKNEKLLEKTDENDVKAIAYFLKISPNSFSTLKSFSPVSLEEYTKSKEHIFKSRNELNQDINFARNQSYGLKDNGYSDAVVNWIKKYSLILASNLDKSLCDFVGLEFNQKGNGLKASVKDYKSDKLKILYSIVNTILTPDGNLRVRPDVNRVPYWKYAKEVYFGITPYHMSAGVTASNYKYHKRKASSPCRLSLSLESEKAMKNLNDYEEIKKARTESDKKLRDVWRTIREMIVEKNLR